MNRRTLLKWTAAMGALPRTVARASQSTSPTTATTATGQKESADVGQTIQLFFDYNVVQMIQDLTQVMHRPVRYGGNPVIKRDRTWERVPYFVVSSGNVLYSPTEKLWRCWYEDLMF